LRYGANPKARRKNGQVAYKLTKAKDLRDRLELAMEEYEVRYRIC